MKKILILATGGTIASMEEGDGLTPALTGDDLVAYVPQIEGMCDYTVKQLMNIDSTNMTPAQWLEIRNAIINEYWNYDGFVVLHGTDTMAYTAAALSYLIQNSPKPIVLTGSQQPMAHPFTDAKLNLYHAMLYACDDDSCDVCIVFGGLAIAGTRARKVRTLSFNAFESMNYPELARIRGDKIVRVAGAQGAHSSAKGMRVYDKIDPYVAVIKLTPGMKPRMFELLAEDYDALIIETFGLGGIPNTPAFKEAIFNWVDSGKTLVITTQVPEEGCDLGVYEVGKTYAKHPGVLLGGDMTTEALVAKTMWARAEASTHEETRKLFNHVINHDRLMNM